MFPLDLDGYSARDTLAAVADVHDIQGQADIAELRLGLHFADLHPDPATVPGGRLIPGGERGVVYGGAGCPAVAEFAAAEFGAVTGRSTVAAARYLGQCLALRHRLPLTYAQVLSGHAAVWKARSIASACLELSQEAAAIVDRRVASIIDSVTPLRLANIVRAAMWQADPEAAKAAAEERAKKRGVWVGRTDDHGTTMLFVRAATGAVIRFNATLTQIADALAALGDTDTLEQRRAKAIGVLADPALADKLLRVAHHLASSLDAPVHPDAAATDTNADTRARADTATHTPADAHAESHAADAAQACTYASARTCADGVDPTCADGVDHTCADTADHTCADTADHTCADTVDPTCADPTCADGAAHTHAAAHAEPGPQPATEPTTEPTDPRQPSPSPSGLTTPADDASDDGAFIDDSPHPSDPAFDDYLLDPAPPLGANDHGSTAEESNTAMDWPARRDLARKLNAIQQLAHTGQRPRRTVLYAHITDETLLAGGGVARVEGFGPVYAHKLRELLGHDQVVIQPVIDLNTPISVDAYEIPHRIREQVKLTYPVEQFPYGTAATTSSTDLDHLTAFDPNGPPGQTSTTNLVPLRRFSHRVKTHGRWKVQRIDDQTQEWTTRHGFKFRVDPTGTHRIDDF
jgi:hypothetical protein